MNKTQVELHVPDFQKVKDFYCALGFTIVKETAPIKKNGYLILEFEGNQIRFWAGNEQVYEQSYFSKFPRDTVRGYGVEVIISCLDVVSLYKRAEQRGAVVSKLQKRPWGLTDFRVVDPFGYYLRFTEGKES